ncbi:SH2 domain-containing adapter protein F [Adelges cooleyi]|uniref:SH2 domain-containing adapter protein F n=1 Tax=Adelges cooleyi TaxID=133065 RepID=UPI00217F2A51|nr:SH2 domain-containing adapter protein F [Adelges cooleyi]
MSTKKYRRIYETAFDSKISKSDDDLLSSEQHDAAIAHKLIDRLQLSASTCSVPHKCHAPRPKNRLFGFLKRRVGQKYRSSDSMVTSSSLSLESITSDSLSSHSSESPYCKPYPEPHVLSPISDKSSLDAAELLDQERRKPVTVKTKPPQSLGLLKLNRDHQHHGSDSGISVGSKPGDNSYQELLDLPFDMPKLRRKQRNSEVFHETVKPALSAGTGELAELPFDMPKLRRKQTNLNSDAMPAFDMSKLRRKQMESCARVISLNFEIGHDAATTCFSPEKNNVDKKTDRNEDVEFNHLPFDMPKLKKINTNNEPGRKPDRNSLFLNVRPSSSMIDDTSKTLTERTLQNKNQSNRPALSLSNIKPLNFVEDIDVTLPLDQQHWYHGPLKRIESEKILQNQGEGSYLIRETKGSYALSIKSAKGIIHMKITSTNGKNYLGQSDRSFNTIPELIRHYTLNKLPAKGAEHVGLIRPITQQIL